MSLQDICGVKFSLADWLAINPSLVHKDFLQVFQGIMLSRLRNKLLSLVKKKSYALNELDIKLANHINFGGGFFVEVGANDGIAQSNTLYFEKHMGWGGLLIEAIPALADKCRQNRPKCIVENCALVEADYGRYTVEMRYCNLMSVVKGGMHNEEDEGEHIRNGARFLQKQEQVYTINVPAATLSHVLEKHCIKHVDMLSLDVEGYEAQVLRGLELDQYGPDFMLIECRYKKDIEAVISGHYREIAVLSMNESYSDVLYQKMSISNDH